MSGSTSTCYPVELRERGVRMVAEIRADHEPEWAAISKVAELLGVGTPETVRNWCRQAEADAGQRPGMTTEESAELKVSGLAGAVHFPGPAMMLIRGSSGEHLT